MHSVLPLLLLAMEALVLDGHLVTMTERGVINGGRLVLEDGVIREVYDSPTGSAEADRIDTNAWIFPGFVNLHTHMPFNHQPLWVSDRKFENRYQWQAYEPHIRAVMSPEAILSGRWEYNIRDEQMLFSEVRALVGGTTSLIASQPSSYVAPGRLVRNIEYEAPRGGRVVVRVEEVDEAFLAENARHLRASMDEGDVRAWVVHLAEGIDGRSRNEFERLQRHDLVRRETVVVHGTGLDSDQLASLGRVGGHLVWAPTSNILLYGRMADVGSALENGVTVSLSNDWAPSGTHNLLAELKVAEAAYRDRHGSALPARTLVQMITVNPAKAVGWEEHAGSLREGAQADVVVVRRRSDDPYEDLLRAADEDVELVFVGGDPLYGRQDWMEALKPEDTELLETMSKRVDVTRTPGDRTLAQARARLRAALRFDTGDMLARFLDADGRTLSEEALLRHVQESYPGLEAQPLPPLFLSNDPEFFERLRAMDFPYTDALADVYRSAKCE